MAFTSIEALRAELDRNDVVASAFLDRYKELHDVIHNPTPSLVAQLGVGGNVCAYCGRPGAVGASCVSCGAYVSAPKPPTLPKLIVYNEADDWPDVGRVAFFVAVPIVIIFFVFSLLGP